MRGSPGRHGELIRWIAKDDQRVGGKLRLIAVYTGEGDLGGLRAEVYQFLLDAGVVTSKDDDGALALVGSHIRIVFLNKHHSRLDGLVNTVQEADLPGRLVHEFSTMSVGIMPGVAMASVAAIREGTHHLLAKFSPDLDGALAAHRAMIPTPEDAETYASDLVAEEIRAILEGGYGGEFARSAHCDERVGR